MENVSVGMSCQHDSDYIAIFKEKFHEGLLVEAIVISLSF